MSLSEQLVSLFAKTVVAQNSKKDTNAAKTVYGKIIEYNGRTYAQLDGSDQLTPIETTTSVKDGDRVTVKIENHTATVTGNLSDPAASADTVDKMGTHISEFEIIIADRITADEAFIGNLAADHATFKEATVSNLEAANASIGQLEAKDVEITGTLTAVEANIKNLETEKVSTEFLEANYAEIGDLNATNATIRDLEATYGDFQELTTRELEAVNADIKNLDTEKLDAKEAAIKYAEIDFANITEAAIKKVFIDYGIIDEFVAESGTVVKELIGVTIKGDLIEANTLKAESLIVKGEDGLYYKLNVAAGVTTSEQLTEEELQNGLHGSVIIAKSITAEKINVSDLVAFGATIAGFNIEKENGVGKLYSGVKDAVNNSTPGVYMDDSGQFALGDNDNYLIFYKTEDDSFKIAISAESILFGSGKDSLDTVLSDMKQATDKAQESADNIMIGGRNLLPDTREVITIQNETRSIGFTTYGLEVLKRGGNVVLSFDAMSDENVMVRTHPHYKNLDTGSIYVNSSVLNMTTITTEWKHYSIQTLLPDFTNRNCEWVDWSIRSDSGLSGGSDTATISVRNIKLEVGTKATDWTPAPEDVDGQFADTHEIIVEQGANLTGAYELAISIALEEYSKTGDFEAFKQSVDEALGLISDDVSTKYEDTTERINDVDTTMQDKFAVLDGYIQIDPANATITLGRGGGGLSLVLENDMISFRKDGEQFGYWDGNDFHTGNIVVEVNERAQFGNFAFLPRTDGSLMLLKVGGS